MRARGRYGLRMHACKPQLKPDISNDEIARAANSSINTLVSQRDEGKAAEVMAEGATKIIKRARKASADVVLGGLPFLSLLYDGYKPNPGPISAFKLDGKTCNSDPLSSHLVDVPTYVLVEDYAVFK